MLEQLVIQLGRLALSAQLGRDPGDRRLEHVVQPPAGEGGGGDRLLTPLRELGPETVEVVEQSPRLVLLRAKASQLQQPAPVMPGLQYVRLQTQPVSLIGPLQLDLAGVEAELVQAAKPLLEVEALVLGKDLLVSQLVPEPLVRAEHLIDELERLVEAHIEQLAVEVLAREIEVVHALPVGKLS